MDATIRYEAARGKSPEGPVDPFDGVIARFERDDFAPLPGLIASRAAGLRALIDRTSDADPRADDTVGHGFMLVRICGLDRASRDPLAHDPVNSIFELIPGANWSR